jgi:hypothetical protein
VGRDDWLWTGQRSCAHFSAVLNQVFRSFLQSHRENAVSHKVFAVPRYVAIKV